MSQGSQAALRSTVMPGTINLALRSKLLPQLLFLFAPGEGTAARAFRMDWRLTDRTVLQSFPTPDGTMVVSLIGESLKCDGGKEGALDKSKCISVGFKHKESSVDDFFTSSTPCHRFM